MKIIFSSKFILAQKLQEETLPETVPQENTEQEETDDLNIPNPTPEIDPDNINMLTPEDVFADNYLVDEEEEKEGEIPTLDEEVIKETRTPTSLLPDFNLAISEKEVLRIYYTTIRGTYIIRDVEPHGRFFARTTLKEILVTWDETVGAIRAFRADGVQKYQFTGNRFRPKFTFSPRRSLGKTRMRKNLDRRRENKVKTLR